MRLLVVLLSIVIATIVRAAPPAGAPDKVRLQQALEAAVKASGLDVGVAIQDLVTGDEFLIKPDDVFPQGSSIRIHLVSELFRQAAAKKVLPDAPFPLPDAARAGGTGVLRYMARGSVSMSLRDYAVLMIAVNDHSAANVLTDVLGMDHVNASLVAQGTPEIKFKRRAVSRREAPNAPENEGTPRAVMRALGLIHRGQVVDRATSDAILDVLCVAEISYFRRELPPGTLFAGHSGSGPTMRCDAGIVMLANRPYILCVMVKGLHLPIAAPRDYSKADAVIGLVTRLAQRYFSSLAAGERKASGG